MNVHELLEELIAGNDIGEEGAATLLRQIASGDCPPELAGALLSALRIKGESGAEVRGFATAMRELALRPPIEQPGELVDCVGTGGDGSGSLNLSTGSALLAAACGARLVKHGNRAMSSKSGSADVLEALGYALPRDGHAAAASLDMTGFTFLFAPHFHPATRAIGPVRKSLGIRTVFNLLGPLVNPAQPGFNVIGAYSEDAARLMADALAGMDVRRAFVIHGEPGWDEATPVGPFLRLDVRDGRVAEETIDPESLGIARCEPGDLAGGNAQQNAAAIEAVFSASDRGAHRDALTLGAGLVLEVCGKVDDLRHGVELTAHALDEGHANSLLGRLRRFTAEAA